MKGFFDKRGKVLSIFIITIVSLILMVSAVSMLSQFADEVSEQAKVKATYYSYTAKENIVLKLEEYTHKASVLAGVSSTFTDNTALGEYLRQVTQLDGYEDVSFVRYYKGDTLYTDSGVVFTESDPSRNIRKTSPDKPGFVGISADNSVVDGNMEIVGFYSPVVDSSVVDGIVVYYARQVVRNALKSVMPKNDSELSVLCTSEGTVIVDNGSKRQIDTMFLLTEIRSMVGRKEPVDEIEKLLSKSLSGTVDLRINESDYLVSVSADTETMKDLAVVELYSVDVLSESTFDLIHTIIAIMVIFAIIVVALILYLIWNRIKITRELFNIETHNKKLGCFNRHGFEVEATKILDRNRASHFFVLSINLRHYKYLTDTYGADVIYDLVRFLRQIISKSVIIEETYGHVTDGQFLILVHCKDHETLIDRLKVLAFLCSKYQKKHKFDVLTSVGIYELSEGEHLPITQMVDFANEARNATTGKIAITTGMQISFYSEEIKLQRQFNDDMELRMDGALKNGEFQIFMQPKFNLKTGRQDGCEALVRWYDPIRNEYNRPSLFMELFESNGFITKLDRYVFTKVCEYISYSIAQGRPVFPVSVNISRVTAIEPGFVEYYSETKKKYGIKNGLIMIEFTESFAYENYKALHDIVEKLHANGFKCSIDDFGCGYSSYLILKSLPMDEIKLDKIFLQDGVSEERDQTIYESLIGVGKKLGMKVTQEGVETYEDVVRLKKLNCDVIQGYFYSHPLPLSDYITFAASSRSHDIDLSNI